MAVEKQESPSLTHEGLLCSILLTSLTPFTFSAQFFPLSLPEMSHPTHPSMTSLCKPTMWGMRKKDAWNRSEQSINTGVQAKGNSPHGSPRTHLNTQLGPNGCWLVCKHQEKMYFPHYTGSAFFHFIYTYSGKTKKGKSTNETKFSNDLTSSPVWRNTW